MNQMASTRVFQIYELAEHIILDTFCRSASTGLTGGGTLAALARVNRLLSTIAIPEIWRILGSGAPLISLLPPDIDRLVDPAIANRRMIKGLDLRGVTYRDLEPYMRYGWYVKELDLTQDSLAMCAMLEKADHLVEVLGFNDRHLANLQSLSISTSHLVDFTRYINARSKGAVKTLRVVLGHVLEQAWFEEISNSFAHITSLEIAGVDQSATSSSLQSEIIPILDNLLQLIWLTISIDVDTIRALLPKVRNLPSLKHLGLKTPKTETPYQPNFDDMDSDEKIDGHRFLGLRYWGYTGGGELYTILRLSLHLSIFYREIIFEISPFIDPREMEKVVQWISSHYPQIWALAFLDVEQPHEHLLESIFHHALNPRLPFATPASTLCQLGGLRNLRHLILETFGGYILTSEVLDTLATSLSLLERCAFGSYRNHDQAGDPSSDIKILDIVKFAIRCPKLQALRVYFDARKPQDVDVDSELIIDGTSRLIQLDVGNSLIDDAEYVAKILQESLPELHIISTNTYLAMHRSLLVTAAELNLWQEVREMLQVK